MERLQANTQQTRTTKEIFGSFFLSDGEFALSVRFVQEVVNAPGVYTSIPLAPSYLKGLFNLRGVVIPVIDLHDLLQLKRDERAEQQKVAIIELNGNCIGLLFDKTGEIFGSNEEERSDFESVDAKSVVSGVFKKENGKRILQILNVENLFKVQNVPKDSSLNRMARESLGRKRGQRQQCISFSVGPASCSLPISEIQEILKVEKLNSSALGSGFCIGALDLRGMTVPVVDFPALLQYREVDRSAEATSGSRRVVVMRLENELFGLLVDSIDSIISYFPDELISFPVLEQARSQMFIGCISGSGNSDVILLNSAKILSDAEIIEITKGHSKLYNASKSTEKSAKELKSSRRSYITFGIGSLYALPISEIKEIIDFPSDLLQPPGLKNFVRGILNLRGELITIIDTRTMYGLQGQSTSPEASKVLIFKQEQYHYGLIVDSVESIVTIIEKDKIKLPEALYGKNKSDLSSDISDSTEIIENSGAKKSVLIFCLESLNKRVVNSLAA